MDKKALNIKKTFYKTKKNTQNKKNKNGKQMSRRMLSVVFTLLMTFLLTSFIVIGYVASYIISFTNGKVAIDLNLYKADQSQTSFIYAYDKNGKEVEYAQLHGEENRVLVSLDKMNKYLPQAFICLEDKRFETHKGVDWYRFLGVITKYNFDQGASTITQQLIKNLTGEKDVTVVRKFNEIIFALNLEKHYSKDIILETYLNTLYLGNSCYGVETAAETYFGKNVSELNLAECASIAAITQAPFTFDPLYNPENNKKRQEYCLSEMLSQGAINQEEYNSAITYKMIYTNSPGYVAKVTDEKPVEEKSEFQSFYVDFVIDNVIKDLMAKYGDTVQQATNKIYYGGLKIYAAVDVDVQKSLEDVYYNRIAFPKQVDTATNPAIQSAMTVMDYKGRVVGIIGKAGPKVGNRCLNRAADSPRQPGSSIKPLATYGPAIELNYINWSTMIINYGFPYQGMKLWPQNADGTPGSGKEVTVQYALQNSLNTVAARIVVDILTPKTCMDYVQNKFHISTIIPEKDAFAAPMTVGALTKGVTTLDMAAAYAAFGNGGIYYKPFCYSKVTAKDGKEILLETKSVGEQIISPETADVMCELLQTVKTKDFGVGGNVRKFQIFAKTGSTDSFKDRWTIGGTPYYVGAVWYGYDKPKYIPGSYPNPAGKVLIEVFDRIHKGLVVKKFEKSGLTVQKKYCLVSGLIANDYCKTTAMGWYKISNIPETCTTCTGSVVDVIDGIINQINPNETTTSDSSAIEDFFNNIFN